MSRRSDVGYKGFSGVHPERWVALVMAMSVCVSQVASSETVRVGGDFNRLQGVLDSVSIGDTVIVHGGTYEGNLRIDKRVFLIGRDKPVLTGNGKGSVVTVRADSCLIAGFAIEHSGALLTNEDAGILVLSDDNVIRDNHLIDVLFGIYLLGSDRNLISGNRIVGMKHLELGQRGSGIHVFNSSSNRFVNNSLTDVRDGFYIQYANHSWIENCEAFGVRYGVHYMYADSNTFLGNRFHHNLAGAAIMYSHGITMRRNVIANNRGFSSYGILFQDCHGLVADSNIVADNGTGMFFEASTNNLFRGNMIARNDVAFQIFQSSFGNIFTENAIVDNLSPLVIVGKRTGSHWSLNGRGNYWSTYDGYDLDGDGIGDVPMKIQNVFEFLEGRNPAVRIYLYSPAAQALSLAANAFPILDLNKEVDFAPLVRPGLAAWKESKERSSRTLWSLFPVVGVVCGGVAYFHFSTKRR